MKKIIFAILTALMVQNVQAQNNVYFQWNPSVVKDDGVSYHFTGMTLGYSRTFSFTPSAPFFLEVGGALQYSFGDEDLDYAFSFKDDSFGYDFSITNLDITFVSVKVPVNLTYNWEVSDNFAIAPFVGITSRFNLWGNYNLFYKENGKPGSVSGNNMFSKKGLSGHRFQLGWHVGANFKFNKMFYIGGSYGTDFIDFDYEHSKVHTTSVTAGIIF